jgi:transcriptional regulator with XRE-family HTH domain
LKILQVCRFWPIITPEQIRGARAMLGLTQAQLAARAGLSKTGLNNIERGKADPKASTLVAIQSALESAGIEFTNGDAPGVRLRGKPRRKALAAGKRNARDDA